MRVVFRSHAQTALLPVEEVGGGGEVVNACLMGSGIQNLIEGGVEGEGEPGLLIVTAPRTIGNLDWRGEGGIWC